MISSYQRIYMYDLAKPVLCNGDGIVKDNYESS